MVSDHPTLFIPSKLHFMNNISVYSSELCYALLRVHVAICSAVHCVYIHVHVLNVYQILSIAASFLESFNLPSDNVHIPTLFNLNYKLSETFMQVDRVEKGGN